MASDPGEKTGRERFILVVITFITALLSTVFSTMLILAPVPLAVLIYRHGLRPGISTALFSGILVGGLLQHPIPMLLIIFVLALGVAIGEALRDGFNVRQILLVGWAVTFLAFTAFFLVSRYTFGIDLVEAAVDVWLEQLGKFTTASGGIPLSEEELAQLSGHLRAIWPGTMAISSVFVCVVNYWLVRRWLSRLGEEVPSFTPFARWRVPWYLTWGYIAGLGIPLLPGISRTPWLIVLAANLELVSRFLFTVQGLAVMWFYLTRWGVRKWIRIIIAGLSALVMPLLVFIGLLDSWFDLRRLDRESSEDT